MLQPYTYVYYNTTMQRKTEEPKSFLNHYSTDVIRDRALEYLNDAHSKGNPFFLAIAPIGPHIQTTPPGHSTKDFPHVPIPAHRHEGLFKDETIPNVHKNFNPEKVCQPQAL